MTSDEKLDLCLNEIVKLTEKVGYLDGRLDAHCGKQPETLYLSKCSFFESCPCSGKGHAGCYNVAPCFKR